MFDLSYSMASEQQEQTVWVFHSLTEKAALDVRILSGALPEPVVVDISFKHTSAAGPPTALVILNRASGILSTGARSLSV